MKTKLFPILFTFILLSSCAEKPEKQVEQTDVVSESGVEATYNLDSIVNAENAKNEWKRTDILLCSQIAVDTLTFINRVPRVDSSSSESMVFSYEWMEDLYSYDMFIEVSDREKIELGKEYHFPNDLIKVEGVCYGLLSNFDVLKNEQGTMMFSALYDDYVRLELSLVGDLTEMRKLENTTIINEEIVVLKNYSCYTGYSPENKLGVNLDSIRELESIKNIDHSRANIYPQARVVEISLGGGVDHINVVTDTIKYANSLVIEYLWRPTGATNQILYFELLDKDKIEPGKEYQIPHELISVKGEVHASMGRSTLFESVKGSLKFETLHEDYTVLQVFLKEESTDKVILDDKLFLLNGFAWQRW